MSSIIFQKLFNHCLSFDFSNFRNFNIHVHLPNDFLIFSISVLSPFAYLIKAFIVLGDIPVEYTIFLPSGNFTSKSHNSLNLLYVILAGHVGIEPTTKSFRNSCSAN